MIRTNPVVGEGQMRVQISTPSSASSSSNDSQSGVASPPSIPRMHMEISALSGVSSVSSVSSMGGGAFSAFSPPMSSVPSALTLDAASTSSPHSACFSWPVLSPSFRVRTDPPPSKPHCQSPEQRRCTLFHTSPAVEEELGHHAPAWCPFQSDVHAFGALLAEMLSGQRWGAQLAQRAAAAAALVHSSFDAPTLEQLGWDLVHQCTAPASQRISVQQMAQHPFLQQQRSG